METNPGEAVTNNIWGTQNLVRAALLVDVDRFVMISSDKAVNPTSVMGACKRVAELIVLDAAQRSGKPYAAVRFGNVLGSRGSVVLTFKQQIAAGGPVTVTDPDVKRFFMTISEAVQLLLQAAALEQGNEIFMLDMGEPVRIVDLAHDLIRLSGLEVGRDIDIEFTGLRPGEKMYEELFLAGEEYHTTAHPKIRIAATAGRFVPDELVKTTATLLQAAESGRPDEIRELLCKLVPEYRSGVEAALPVHQPLVRAEHPTPAEKSGTFRQNGTTPHVPVPVGRLARPNVAPNQI
jgi:FlaA1/EpsC-like NDP-sugar epimerase